MATRTAPRSTKKTASAKAVEDVAPKQTADTDREGINRAYEAYMNAQENLLKALKAPGWKRTLCAWIGSLFVAGAIGWLVGLVVDLLVFATVALTSSFYAGMAIWLLGLFTAIVLAGYGAQKAWDAIITGRVEETAREAFSTVRNWFSAKKVIAHA